MIRSLLFLLFIVFLSNRLNAQQSTVINNSNPEKSPAAVSASGAGFKKQSSAPSPRQKKQAVGDKTIVSDKQTLAGIAPTTSMTESIVATDYARMPADVQLKLNNNKAQGKDLLDGISKGFTVQINACRTDAAREKILSFLKTKKGFTSSEFVSPGLVKIIVDPSFDSGDLKDSMDAERIVFNFINRFYLLKK